MTDEFLILHALHVRGMATAEAIEEAWGVEGAADHLRRLVDCGACMYRDRPPAVGYVLLRPGRDRYGVISAETRAALDPTSLSALAAVDERFTPLNGPFKALCSRWQMRGSVSNDHSDAEYDESCIAELEDTHGRVMPLVTRAARAVPHFGRYGPRFRAALARLVEGDLDFFTSLWVSSYHTVWMELHADLMVTVGRERQAHEA